MFLILVGLGLIVFVLSGMFSESLEKTREHQREKEEPTTTCGDLIHRIKYPKGK